MKVDLAWSRELGSRPSALSGQLPSLFPTTLPREGLKRGNDVLCVIRGTIEGDGIASSPNSEQATVANQTAERGLSLR